MSEKPDTHLKKYMGKPAERQRRKAKGPSPNFGKAASCEKRGVWMATPFKTGV